MAEFYEWACTYIIQLGQFLPRYDPGVLNARL